MLSTIVLLLVQASSRGLPRSRANPRCGEQLLDAEIPEILSRFEQAEFGAAWAALKATHGDDLTVMMLEPTSSQRHADALVAVFLAAVSTPAGGQAPASVVNIIVDQGHVRGVGRGRSHGHTTPPPDPTDMSRRCETDAGVPVDPVHAVAAALVGHVRRVVMSSAGVVIEMAARKWQPVSAVRAP